MEQSEQELVMKLSVFEQQMRQIQQQLEAVQQGIEEISSLSTGLDELAGNADREILANIGRGIFVKAKLLSEDLIVDIGDKNFVKKNIPETKKIIEEQIRKLELVKKELEENLERISDEARSIIEEAEGRNQ